MKASRTPARPAVQAGAGSRQWLSRPWLWLAVLLGGALVVLFCRSFQPGEVLFVNDTTLGQMKAAPNRLPAAFTGVWHTASWLGIEGVASAPSLSAILALLLSPEVFLKIYAPFSLFFVGFCAWVFFRQLGFNTAVCVLGGVAAGLNMHFFSVACWGLGSWNIAAGMVFLALAVVHAKSIPQIWAKGILAGLAAGMNLMEGFDVGAISCIYLGCYIVWHIFTQAGPIGRKVLTALCMGALVIFSSALIAAHSIASLVETQVKGVTMVAQDEQSKEQRWNPATKWSLPKTETLGIFVPGLFGYGMAERIVGPDKSSAYWGTVGQDPRLSAIRDGPASKRAEAIASINPPPQVAEALQSDDPKTRSDAIQVLLDHSPALVRYVGSGEYAGILVSVLAVFALVNSLRGAGAPYSSGERRALWFWGGAAVFSVLAAWGRHGFLYRLLYQLPYISTIRNPIKFLHPFHIAWVILAAYGMEALWRRYLQPAERRTEPLPVYLQKWWKCAASFEKKWAAGSLALIGVAVVALLIFSASKPRLVEYLSENAVTGPRAIQTADFSIAKARWFVVWLLMSAGVVVVLTSGAWSGLQARSAWFLLGAFLMFDLARTDTPWIHYYNYKQVYGENSVVDFLQDKPYEHRVIGRLSPQGPGSSMNTPMAKLYDFWQQNDFPLHGIQTLDVAQWARVPELDAAYLKNFALRGEELAHADLWPVERLWELSNTRYIISMAVLAPLLNQHTDARHAVSIKTFLRLASKADVTAVEDIGDMTAVPDGHGSYALMEFSNCLPRAKLYSHWETPTNDQAVLQLLASREFDPQQTVLVARETPVGQLPGDARQEPGVVTITDYRPKRVQLQASAATPAVLLLNDRIAPDWKVRVDGRPAALLRCNYLMRGVFLTPGEHTIVFRFQPPLAALYVSLCGWGVGILTAGYLIVSRRPVPMAAPAPTPVPPSTPNQPEKSSQASQAAPAGRSGPRRRK